MMNLFMDKLFIGQINTITKLNKPPIHTHTHTFIYRKFTQPINKSTLNSLLKDTIF